MYLNIMKYIILKLMALKVKYLINKIFPYIFSDEKWQKAFNTVWLTKRGKTMWLNKNHTGKYTETRFLFLNKLLK